MADTAERDEPAAPRRHARPRRWHRFFAWLAVQLDRIEPRIRAVPEWVVFVGIGVLGGLVRFIALDWPHTLVFDETYYVKDAWGLWLNGHEVTWPDGADEGFAAGTPPDPNDRAAFIVHPPLGRWMIGLGEALFGIASPWGWRFAVAAAGTIAVLAVYLIGRLLTRSRLVAAFAGVFMAIDGNAIVMSRVTLLDGLAMFWGALGLVAVLLDRGMRDRRFGSGRLGVGLARPWLIAAGALFGASAATKWSGWGYLAAFGLYVVISEALARRRAGQTRWVGASIRQAVLAFLLMVPIAAAVYVASWTGWFVTEGGQYRNWAELADHAWTGAFSWVPHSIQSWWHYQVQMYEFHAGLAKPHPWSFPSWSWPLMIRPTLMYAEYFDGCWSSCAQIITGASNPLIWWGGWAAAVWLVVVVIRRRSSIPGFLLTGIAAIWVPWLAYPERIGFQFYSIPVEPFIVVALAVALARIAGRRSLLGEERPWVLRRRARKLGLDADADDPAIVATVPTDDRTAPGRVTVAILLAGIALVSVWWWPLWTGMTVPLWFMWIHAWIPTWF